jgi:mannose-6-phosphate isomerase-like protein (cupin superfamily)
MNIKGTEHLSRIWKELIAKINPGKPTFFSLAAQIPSLGRFDNAVAATPNMTVMLKTYASGGENAQHAHLNEDHVFLVLQGEATFVGPAGETRVTEPLDGVMLPKGAFYSFQSSGSEALVMLRIGCVPLDSEDPFARVGSNGLPMSGLSPENKHVDPIFSNQWFGKRVPATDKNQG